MTTNAPLSLLWHLVCLLFKDLACCLSDLSHTARDGISVFDGIKVWQEGICRAVLCRLLCAAFFRAAFLLVSMCLPGWSTSLRLFLMPCVERLNSPNVSLNLAFFTSFENRDVDNECPSS